jgi:hypothetical protein
MRRVVAVTGLLLSLSACTSAETPPRAAPPSEPEPDRALVAWADSVCTQVASLVGLITEAGKEIEPYHVSSVVGEALATLSELDPSGIASADAYVEALTGRLERLRDDLPDDGEGSAASRVGEKLTDLGPQEPELVALTETTPELAVSVHLAPGCSPLDPPPSMSTEATRALMEWANTMCVTLTTLTDQPDPIDPLFEDSRFAQFEPYHLASYLDEVRGVVTHVRESVAAMAETGLDVADSYRAELLTALGQAVEDLPGDHGPFHYHDLPAAEVREEAKRAHGVVEELAQRPAPSDVARRHPGLAAAHDLAPRCQPSAPPSPDPLPAAKDGTNVAACADGRCQIEISDPVDVTVAGARFTVAVSEGRLWLAQDSGFIQLRGPGTARFGHSGGTTVFSVVASDDTTAVVDVTTE